MKNLTESDPAGLKFRMLITVETSAMVPTRNQAAGVKDPDPAVKKSLDPDLQSCFLQQRRISPMALILNGNSKISAHM